MLWRVTPILSVAKANYWQGRNTLPRCGRQMVAIKRQHQKQHALHARARGSSQIPGNLRDRVRPAQREAGAFTSKREERAGWASDGSRSGCSHKLLRATDSCGPGLEPASPAPRPALGPASFLVLTPIHPFTHTPINIPSEILILQMRTLRPGDGEWLCCGPSGSGWSRSHS